MRSNVLTIAKKELARFFSNKASAFVSIALPGLLIFLMWTVMGDAMGSLFSPDEGKRPVVAAVNVPASRAPDHSVTSSCSCDSSRTSSR